jgi:hypothetical protein
MKFFSRALMLGALVLLAPASGPQAAEPQTEKTGIWKYYVPKDAKGELDNYDPIGLIGGALIKTDCAYNWRDDAGRMYCFATPTSLVYFEAWPKRYIEQASEALQKLKPGS